MKEALILIDIQNDYFPGGAHALRGMTKAAKKAARLADDFRAAGLPVIHVRHVSLGKGATFFRPDTKGVEFNPLSTPRNGEKIFVKHYPNSFRETGLQEYLDSLGIKKLHLAGAMTNMCIDTAARAGFDLGYKMVVRADCCAAPGILGTKLMHRLFIRNLGSVFAEIA
jgi:nicotinamidase-related amidase